MSDEHGWLSALSTDQLVQACRAAGVKVDGFRNLNMVPRLLLERQIWTVLTRQRGYARPVRLRSTLADGWRERYAALAELLKAGPPDLVAARSDESQGDLRPKDQRSADQESEGLGSEVERWGEWIAELCRRFGRAPVEMGVRLGEVPPPAADGEFWSQLEGYWPNDAPPTPEAAPPVLAEPEAEPTASEQSEEEGAAEEMATPPRQGWQQERAQLRAKIKSLNQEIQLLQRARTSAEARAAHYQAQVEQVRSEMGALANRTDWPHPTMLVQRLIRGLMEARRQIMDLQMANAELRRAREEAAGVQADPDDETEPEDSGAGN